MDGQEERERMLGQATVVPHLGVDTALHDAEEKAGDERTAVDEHVSVPQWIISYAARQDVLSPIRIAGV